MNVKSVRIVVGGRVQGVGYRAWVADRAAKLGVRGWVHNRSDGKVEAVLSAPADVVDRMIDLCRTGPRHSGVTGIDVSPAADEGWPDFSVRPSW